MCAETTRRLELRTTRPTTETVTIRRAGIRREVAFLFRRRSLQVGVAIRLARPVAVPELSVTVDARQELFGGHRKPRLVCVRSRKRLHLVFIPSGLEEGIYDLLIGGSPCTYWSISRGGNNRETTSSGFGFELFNQYMRALREAKPKYYLYENNASMSDDIKAEITKAFGHEPIELNSADFSAQVRHRYYWTNIPLGAKPTPCTDTVQSIIYDNTYKVKSFEKYKDTMKVSADGCVVKWDSSGKSYYSQQNRARIDGKTRQLHESFRFRHKKNSRHRKWLDCKGNRISFKWLKERLKITARKIPSLFYCFFQYFFIYKYLLYMYI